MNKPADLHTHICQTPINDMCRCAKTTGLFYMGISEHVYQLSETRAMLGDFFLEGRVYDTQEYLSMLSERDSEELRILKGAELDYLPGFTQKAYGVIDKYGLDYIIGSVHELNGWDIHDSRRFPTKKADTLWEEYFNTQIELMRICHVEIIAHPVRMAITARNFPKNGKNMMELMVREAVKQNTAIEINAKDCIIAPELVRELINIGKRNNAIFTLGSDAHIPEAISRADGIFKPILTKANPLTVAVFINREPVII